MHNVIMAAILAGREVRIYITTQQHVPPRNENLIGIILYYIINFNGGQYLQEKCPFSEVVHKP